MHTDPITIMTVNGPIAVSDAGITDGHNHLWIEPARGTASGAPVLNDANLIAAELRDYREAGGNTIVDCQPGGCGRDGRMLRQFAWSTGVQIVACTGFHLRRYYTDDFWLWDSDASTICAYFIHELTQALEETRHFNDPVRAGFIKIACEADIARVPVPLWEAAAQAALETGVALEVHTEKGAEAQRILDALADYGVPLNRVVLCHVDKYTDFAFHRALAEQGVLLEYDTFYRPKYQPEKYVWPLLEHMVAAGFERQIVIATDMADRSMWARSRQGPGLTAFMTQIKPHLQKIGLPESTIARLLGQNIAACLAARLAN
jgi:5-phospho-D-xylono-1,4-lactonase